MLILSTKFLFMTTPAPQLRPKTSPGIFQKIHPAFIIMPSVALILSGVMAWANVGLGDAFLPRWGKGFVTSLLVLPLVLMSLGALEKLVDALFESLHWIARKLIVSLLTAFALESVLALVVTAINTPWDQAFAPVWWMAFSRSMPVGILIGLFMSFYLKPKMDRMRRTAVS
jgi:Protein of unknown function (DUF2798)